MILVDLRPLGLTGEKVDKVAERVNVSLNQNSVPGDANAVSPGGVRILVERFDIEPSSDFSAK